MNRIRRTLVLGAGAGGLLLATATAASAHVTASPSATPAGGYTVITFAVPHGCDGSPTTAIAIQMPEGVTSVKPTVVPGWDIEIAKENLAQPIDDGEGGQITDRVASVTYTADEPLPDEYRQVFPVSLKAPDTAGEQLVFPVVQTCTQGETAWVTVPVEGEAEPEHPAPVVALTASTGDEHGGATSDDHGDDAAAPADGTTDDVAAAADSGDDGDGDGTGLAIVALVVGGVGLATGGVALARSRRSA
jgi:uncharacterized protein YcnI